jgi:hypothetical protein
LRRAVGLSRNVDARQFLTDELEVFGVLERRVVRHRHARRLAGQLAERRLAIAGRMMDDAALDREARRRHVPFSCGSRHQHGPRGCAGVAQLHPRIGHGRTAAGALHRAEHEIGVFAGVGRRGFDADMHPIGIELFGDDCRQAGIRALAHFQVLGDHRDAVVRRDPQEGVRREIFRGVGQRAAQGAGPMKADGEARGGRGGAL